MEHGMSNKYISELIDRLEHTEIWEKTDRKCDSYDSGMMLLMEKFTRHKENHTQLFFIGNGGSSAIASHMTADFMKNGGMNTYSLYDNAVTTCMGNDYGYEYIFSRPMEFLVHENDLVVAISSSGNSKNILNAIETAKNRKATVITFTGFQPDNKSKQLGDINVYVPSEKYGIVESIHNLILQQIVDMIMERDGVKL
jgi:D-sedoheptulose 7-phosphate isomerase